MTEDLKKLLAEATPGPWAADKKPTFGDIYIRDDPKNWSGRGRQWIADVNGARGFGQANAALIALAPSLAARVIELEAENANLSDKLELERALCDGAHRRARAALNPTGEA